MATSQNNSKEVQWLVGTLAGVLLFWSAYVFVLFQLMSFPDTRFSELWLEMIKEEEAVYVMILSVASVYAVRFVFATVRLKKKLRKLEAVSPNNPVDSDRS